MGEVVNGKFPELDISKVVDGLTFSVRSGIGISLVVEG
jgi:hypothetical protein